MGSKGGKRKFLLRSGNQRVDGVLEEILPKSPLLPYSPNSVSLQWPV